MHDESLRRGLRAISYRTLIFWSVIVGLGGGVLAAGYYYLLEGALHVVWDVVAKAVGPVWIVTGVGGVLVGLALWKLGVPGEIAAVVDNIHLRRGRIDIRQTPSMTVVSLLSISFGGSAGPEAPLVQIIGSLGSRLGDRLRLHGHLVRTLTFCGMAAALGAFFGAPLGGALFSLEIPHRRGLEYYEAIIPSLVSAFLSFEVFRALVPGEEVLYPFASVPDVTMLTVGQGLALGLLGAGLGVGFIGVFRLVGRT
ncbi:MAG TPA: chloride channel protein, partial [Longimicrobiaceae bacterium]|nr:chloride channel protein [Longimicrobiaceae bacterium]